MKKFIALLLVVALTATISVSATMAYLQDEDSDVNVMTMGNVSIEQLEYERVVENGAWVSTGETDKYGYTPDKVQAFSQAKPLYPAVFADGAIKWDDRNGSQNKSGEGSHQQSWGEVGASGSNQLFDDSVKNAQDKFVFVKNTGKSDAYVRTLIALEQGSITAENFNDVILTNSDLDHWSWEIVATDVEIDGSKYYVICATYKGPTSNPSGILAPDAVSYPSLLQVYMRPEATNEDVENIDGNKNGTYDILVLSQAVQTNGFGTAAEALNAAFPKGENNANVAGWFKGMANIASADSDEELDAAIKEGAQTIVLGDGNYIIPDSAQGKTLTIIGNGDTVIATQDDGSYEGCDYSLDGSTVTFEGVTINTDSSTYTGYARLNATYNNCTINGTYTLYGDSVFNNCTFNVSGDVYNIWTWGAPNATFNNCTFNSDGKAVLLYGQANTNLTVNNCVFNDNGGLTDLKAAIEIGNDYNKSYELIVNNTTVNGYEINDKGIGTNTTLWANKNSMGTDVLNVVVDGVDVY